MSKTTARATARRTGVDLTEWGMPGSDNWNDKISSNDWWCG